MTLTKNDSTNAGQTTSQRSAPKLDKRDELLLLINSRNPILTIETSEEERAEQLLFEVATQLGVPLFTWSVTTGLARFHGSPIYSSETPEAALSNMAAVQGDGIFLLKDFVRYCDNDRVCRRLRELAEQFRTARRSIVITAGSVQLPPELHGDAAAFDLGLPLLDEVSAAVKQALAELSRENHIAVTFDLAAIQQLAKNLSGLPLTEAMRTLRRCVLAHGKADASVLDAVLDAKREALRGDGLLEAVRRDASFDDIAGLQRLREWLAKRKSALTPEGQRFGLVPPKGILITGVQGCGKSLAGKQSTVSGDLNWPGWMRELCTINSWVKVKRSCAKLWIWRRKWRRWFCG